MSDMDALRIDNSSQKRRGEGNILIWSFDRFEVSVRPEQCLLDCLFTIISNFVDTCKRKIFFIFITVHQ